MIFYLFVYFYLGLTIKKHIILNIILGLLFYFFKIRKLKIKDQILILFFFILGIILIILSNLNLISNYMIVIKSRDNYFIGKSLFNNYYVKYENNPYNVFDVLKIEGKIDDYKFNFYESQFDFNNYLKENLINKEFLYSNVKCIWHSIFNLKKIKLTIRSKYEYLNNEILNYLIFNDSLNQDYTNLIYKNNLNYFLSLSSLHIYFLISFVKKILLLKKSEKFTNKVSIFISLFFVLISNYKISIIRLMLFQIINYIESYFLKRKINYLNKLSIIYFIISLFDLGYIYSNNFVYSFPLSILLYISYQAKHNIKEKYRKLFTIILIYLYIIPLQLYLNEEVCFLNIFFSLFFTPLILIIFFISGLSIFFNLKNFINIMFNFVYKFLIYFDKINIKFYTSRYNLLLLILTYCILFILIYLFENKRFKQISTFILVYFFLICISFIPINNLYEKKVYFINVGQGDCILIKNRNYNYLIDTGGIKNNDLAINSLIPFFNKNGINHLNYVFLTHNDFDHRGAFESLKNYVKIYNIQDEAFDVISDNDLFFYNLNNYNNLWNEENDRSLVIYLSFYGKNFLFMGDAPKKIEKKIVEDYPNLKIDYLKVGHHGSNTSTSEELISTYKVKEAIIQVGKNNYYHHPNQETIALLNEYNVKIRRTDIDGTIFIKVR